MQKLKFKPLYYLIAICCSTFAIMPLRAQDFWQQTNGPYGANVRDFVATSRGDLFVATDGGVFRSRDRGASWQRMPVGPDRGFFFHLFAASWGDIFAWSLDYRDDLFRSRDHGETWEIVTNMPLRANHLLAEDAEGNLYTTAPGRGLFVSRDRGASWEHFALEGSNVVKLILSARGTWFAPFREGLWRSVDRGRTWEQARFIGPPIDPLLATPIKTIFTMPSGRLLAASESLGIFRSSDEGATWARIDTSDISDSRVSAIGIDQTAHVWAGFSSGLYVSTDEGATWQAVGFNEKSVQALHVDTQNRIFAGLLGEGIYRSEDEGVTWRESNAGLVSSTVLDLAVNSHGHLFAQTLGGRLARSLDRGETWRVVREPYVQAPAIRSDDAVFIAQGGSVLRSYDNGESWATSPRLPGNISRIDLAFNRAGEIYANTQIEVYKSRDDGASWQALGLEAQALIFKKLAVDESDNLYAISASEKLLFSGDDGRTWHTRFTSSSGDYLGPLLLQPFGQIFLGSNEGVFHSTDYGQTWRKIFFDRYVRALARDAAAQLCVATLGGFYVVSSDARNWRSENSGLIGDRVILCLRQSPDGYIYAGTQSFGLFRSREQVAQPPERLDLVRNYPNPFNAGTRLEFVLSQAGFVRLSILSLLGQEIDVLVAQPLAAGRYSFPWTRSNLPGGVYFSRLEAQGVIVTHKMLCVK